MKPHNNINIKYYNTSKRLNNMERLYTYEFFQSQSLKTSRLKNKLPNDTLKIMGTIKEKLNIKDKNIFMRPTYMDKTVIAKKEKELGELYKLLNKISSKTYDRLIVEVVETLHTIDEISYFDMVTEKIFDIIISNEFYGELFAKLYSEICVHFDVFKSLFIEKYNKHIERFEHIEYKSPNDNYDSYCLYVKKLDEIRSMTKFVLCCHSNKVCGFEEVVNLLLCLQKKMISNLEIEEKLNENEMCVNNIFIIFKDKITYLVDDERWNEIQLNHSVLKDTSGKGKNNKIRFKLMDIDDLMKTNK